MRNSNTILASVQVFMDKMQDGDMRDRKYHGVEKTDLEKVALGTP